MNQTPFLAFPRGEQLALLGALRQAGFARRTLCVSRQEEGAQAWFTVTGAGWCRSYLSRPGWERELVVDLQVSAAGAAPGAAA